MTPLRTVRSPAATILAVRTSARIGFVSRWVRYIPIPSTAAMPTPNSSITFVRAELPSLKMKSVERPTEYSPIACLRSSSRPYNRS